MKKKKKKSANIPNSISEAGLQTVKSWILWRKLLCLFVFTFYYETFQNYLVWIARYWSLSFSSCEFTDSLTSSLPSLTSPTPSPGLFQSKSHMSSHLISKFNGVFKLLFQKLNKLWPSKWTLSAVRAHLLTTYGQRLVLGKGLVSHRARYKHMLSSLAEDKRLKLGALVKLQVTL